MRINMVPYSLTNYEENYHHLDNVLSSIRSFVIEHPKPTILEFDYYTSHNLTLFFVEPNFDFNKLQQIIYDINKIMPSIKRIFSKPIIILKDVNDVLPVEVVKKIGQETITYLGNHFNDVSNIKGKLVKPRRLLTELYEDDYSIYENVIFCHFIDAILKYARQTMRVLENMLYASEIMNVNFLERIDHADYFLSLGKLHTGYMRDSIKYYDKAKTSYKKLASIIDTITPYLKKRIYQANKKNTKKMRLKKTNIFKNQKDYRRIFITYKLFLEKKIIDNNERFEIDTNKLQNDYFSFVELLTIFALNNFSFKTSTRKRLNLNKLDNSFTYNGWDITIENYKNLCLIINVKKETTYRIALCPTIHDFDIELDISKLKLDEVVICDPFEKSYLTRDTLLVSMEDIESFRRIQQLFLKGMIYADKVMDTCPFCGAELHYNKEGDQFECNTCHMIIKKAKCDMQNKSYFYAGFPPEIVDQKAVINSFSNKWLLNKTIEGLYHYRNITKINASGDIICPECGEIHKNKLVKTFIN